MLLDSKYISLKVIRGQYVLLTQCCMQCPVYTAFDSAVEALSSATDWAIRYRRSFS